jgi:hypothetical protein
MAATPQATRAAPRQCAESQEGTRVRELCMAKIVNFGIAHGKVTEV